MTEAKAYLNSYKDAIREIARLKKEYEKEMEEIDRIRSPLGGDGQPHSGGISKQTEIKAAELADRAMAIKDAEFDALRIRQRVFRLINAVPGAAGDVLYERYISLKDWDDVALSVGYSMSRTYDLHNQGLYIVNEILNKKVLSY